MPINLIKSEEHKAQFIFERGGVERKKKSGRDAMVEMAQSTLNHGIFATFAGCCCSSTPAWRHRLTVIIVLHCVFASFCLFDLHLI